MEEDDETLEEWLQTSLVAPLFPLLRQGLYHVTSIEGYRGIRRDGFIRPWDGSFRAAYPKINSHARRHGWISLFDFETPTEEQCFQVRNQWSIFLVKDKPVTILIYLSREELAPKLIPNEAVETEAGYCQRLRIPFVEVWYPEPIPLSAAQSCLLVWPTEPVQSRELQADEGGLAELDKVLDEIENFADTSEPKVLTPAEYLIKLAKTRRVPD